MNPGGGAQVAIIASIDITTGTGTTQVNLICRQGSGTGGTQVGSSLGTTVTAANRITTTGIFLDASPLSNIIYTASISQNGASGNGTINRATIVALQVAN
jgi:hypothetical protein